MRRPTTATLRTALVVAAIVVGSLALWGAPGIAQAQTATPTPTPAPTPTATPTPIDPDPDGDGIPNAFDSCPTLPEDLDGFQDADGCPEADNDMDGICDPWLTPALPACDGSDLCPNVAEDYDAYEDSNGCPDPDNDGDGFPDFTDQCPGTDWTAGPDGVPGTGDEPPDELGVPIDTREDYDGIIDTDGCHDSPGDDYDGDLLTDEEEVFIYGTDPTIPDTDGDGCVDGEEVAGDPFLGGTRNPLNPWDFYDVPVPTAFNGPGGMRDRAVSILNDVLGVLEYTGISATFPCNSGPDRIPGTPDDRCYDQDNDADTVPDGVTYDRSAGADWPELGPGKKHSAAPDDAISILTDVLLVLGQTGHDCRAAP